MGIRRSRSKREEMESQTTVINPSAPSETKKEKTEVKISRFARAVAAKKITRNKCIGCDSTTKTYALPSLHHTDSFVNRRPSGMAVQHRLGILPQWRFGFDFVNRAACCLTSLVLRSDHRTLRRTSIRRTVELSPPQLLNALAN